jgi:hypothetical protein
MVLSIYLTFLFNYSLASLLFKTDMGGGGGFPNSVNELDIRTFNNTSGF